MQISGCGYACSECLLGKEGVCETCSPESDLAATCEIMKCLARKGIDICLRCPERYTSEGICETYRKGLRHCPLRIDVLKKRQP